MSNQTESVIKGGSFLLEDISFEQSVHTGRFYMMNKK